jgi:hypothetical protein
MASSMSPDTCASMAAPAQISANAEVRSPGVPSSSPKTMWPGPAVWLTLPGADGRGDQREAADDLEPAHRPRDALGVIDAVLQRDDRDSRSGKRREVLCRRLLGVLGLHAEQHGVAGTDLGGLAGRVHQGVGIPGDAVQVNPGRGWLPGGGRGPRRARRPPPRPAGRQPAADLPAPTTAILMTLTRSLEPGRRGRGPGPARGPRSRPRTPPAGTARCAR